ncbi:MAG: sulfotransferase [Anaerolineales bacterium]|nr:sulfotransferase [Anaerolineales bacterium]
MTRIQTPILVTGVHRSGTTWVGKMLAASGEVAYISEPLNVWHRRGVFAAKIPHWYFYLCKDNEDDYLPAFREMLNYKYRWGQEILSLRSFHDLGRMARDGSAFLLGKVFHRRPLLKDPFAVFSIPWFIERLGCQVVVTVRHPAAFASSLKRLNWPFDMQDLLIQPLLMRDWLEPYREQMCACLAKPQDILQQAAVLWSMAYQTVWRLKEEGYPLWLVRHEDLSLDPLGEFRKLYKGLSLDFTGKAQRHIEESSNAENPKELKKEKVHSVRLDSRSNLMNWRKRLSDEEIEQVKTLTAEVAALYYPTESWEGIYPTS